MTWSIQHDGCYVGWKATPLDCKLLRWTVNQIPGLNLLSEKDHEYHGETSPFGKEDVRIPNGTTA